MSKNILGVYARLNDNPDEDKHKKTLRVLHNTQFRDYLWGKDGHGGLSKALKQLTDDYGQDVELILLQFNVNPVLEWSQPTRQIENFRPKEKSVGVWITIDNDYFDKDEKDRNQYVKDVILSRLQDLKKRFKARKFDIDMDKLISDVDRLLG